MRRTRLLMIAIASFFAAIFGEGLVKRAIALLVCGVFSFNSTTCYTYLTNYNQANATPSFVNIPPAIRREKNSTEMAEIPRIRKPSLELPLDFRVVRQVPFSSGKREISFVSSSTRTEQVYSTSLPDADKFELYGVEFKKVSGVDFRPLLVGTNIQIESTEIEANLKQFRIVFQGNNLDKVILANGNIAKFSASEAVIKSPKGSEIERIKLSSVNTSVDNLLITQLKTKNKYLAKNNLENSDNYQSQIMMAQAGSTSCKTGAKSYLQNSSRQMFQIGDQLVANASKNALLVGGALKYGDISFQNNSLSKEFADTVCQPPIKCNEEVISGGSEIRTDLFQVPQGSERKVSLEYEFFQIPDRLEMDFDGKQVLAIGPASGRSSQTFSFPNNAKYVGVKLIGNQENKGTKWWYKVACSGEKIAHPCNDTRISSSYDKNNPQYHYYKNNNLVKICSKKTRGCTKEKVFETMISEVRFLAPTDSEKKVVSCQEEDLIPGIGFKDYYPKFYENRIKAVINSNNLLVTNYTLPGHMFYPGEIRRRVVDTGDAIKIETIGEGVGDNRTINLLFGTQGLWDLIDNHLREKFQSILSKASSKNK